jgi:hypothetical protein
VASVASKTSLDSVITNYSTTSNDATLLFAEMRNKLKRVGTGKFNPRVWIRSLIISGKE